MKPKDMITRTGGKAWEEIILSDYPVEVTIGSMNRLLARSDELNAREQIIDFIYHRLNHRYINPLRHIAPAQHKSGFLIMASACLLIETMQAFYEGKNQTVRKKGESVRVFHDFFAQHKAYFPGFAEDASGFYTKIRCGILHQAETRGRYRITRHNDAPLFDADTKIINANKFLDALSKSLDAYIEELKKATIDSPVWINAVAKVTFICNNHKEA